MADIGDGGSALTTKLVGADLTGVETNFTAVDAQQRLWVQTQSCATATNAQTNVSNASTVLLAANANRKYAFVANYSGGTIWIMLGAAAQLNRGLQLASGGVFTINADNLWTGSVNAIKSGGGAFPVQVFEGTP